MNVILVDGTAKRWILDRPSYLANLIMFQTTILKRTKYCNILAHPEIY